MKILAENKGWVTLESRHVIAAGGEGTVYGRGDDAFKIYRQPRDLADKIGLLKALDHPGIVAPQGILEDERGQFVGYWMRREAGEALPNLFANAWRHANGFGAAETETTAGAMREVVEFAHSRGALLVDANELNWLVGGVGTRKPASRPVAIDVDSWQIGRYPGTALMPSIKDWQASGFSQSTDWFAWGVVTFQLFTGIHPYKGTHPTFGRGDLEARMRANASIFDAGVRLSSAVRDPSAIPAGLLDWYRAVFRDGVRCPPPTRFGIAAAPTAKIAPAPGQDAVVTISRLHRARPAPPVPPLNANRIAHNRLVRLGGRWFAVVNDSDRGLVELDDSGFVKAQWPAIANATRFFRTGALSWYLGQPYLLAVGDAVCIFPAPFLKSAGRVLDVFTDSGTFALVLTVDPRTGQARRRTTWLQSGAWHEAEVADTEETVVNAAGTGSGVVAHIPDNGELRVYSVRSPSSRSIRSTLIRADMTLETLDGAIVFFDRGEGFRLQLGTSR
jgi:hypothetical protein